MTLKAQKIIPDWLESQLPKYQKADSIAQAFSDSTHHLWRLHGLKNDSNNYFLKVCSNTETPFWQIMHQLFNFDLRAEIADFSDTYDFINKLII